MATAEVQKKLMTTEEFLALPDDGVERWLVHGELREAGMTVRNWLHSTVMAQLTIALGEWWKNATPPRGKIICGEAGVRLPGEPASTVGIDVAYISPQVLPKPSGRSTIFEGVPTLVVEILSPSDKLSDIHEKLDLYLSAGVPLVWTIDPMRRTATVYRPNTPDRLVTENESLSGEDVLSGLSIPLKQLFE
jgi:Uma2 family endonuclease